MIAHYTEYLPNIKLSTAIGFQRTKVTKISRTVLCVRLFTRDPVASLIERFKTQTQLAWKLLLFVDMKTSFRLLIFSGGGLCVFLV